jgi:hypothetical protein
VILDDFVMLGTTVPEPNSDGRIFVCSAGWSDELRKLVRIYPLARRGIPRRWHKYRVPVERNPRDARAESFKVRGDRRFGAHEHINEAFVEVGLTPIRKADLAEPLRKHALVTSIKEANERRLSLALIRPAVIGRRTFDHNPDSPESPQLALFDLPGVPAEAPTAGSKRFPYNPRQEFWDEAGDRHNLQIRDWGGYEFMRKHPGRHSELTYHLTRDSLLLIGNLAQHRTSWLIISVLNGLHEPSAIPLDIFQEAS